MVSKLSKTKSSKSVNNATPFDNYKQYTYDGSEANTGLLHNCLVGFASGVYGKIYKQVLTDGSFLGVCSLGWVGASSTSTLEGVFISVDVNGAKKPNKFGYDIWNFHLNGQNCKVQPTVTYRHIKEDEPGYKSNPGNVLTSGTCSKSITSDSNGFYCAYYALKNQSPDNSSLSYWEGL